MENERLKDETRSTSDFNIRTPRQTSSLSFFSTIIPLPSITLGSSYHELQLRARRGPARRLQAPLC
jgi:hypothetical protein